MQLMLNGDSLGRVVGTIAHNGAKATVTGSDGLSAVAELRSAVESAIADGLGECFWEEAMVEFRWLFRREGDTVRIAILSSLGTLTGWEHLFWAECGLAEFQGVMHQAIGAFAAPAPRS
ncbi:MAG TPA: hypothetical protein VMB03_08770 [Bryobacteraceae bacterium]|nr:hypothetical protein [Bryobacteraceae bacterium]